MKRLLITGANGFVGRHAVPHLGDFELHAVAMRDEVLKPVEGGVSVAWHRADLLDDGECRALFAEVRPSHLLHFAWVTEPGKYWTSDRNLDWVRASVHALRHFRENGGERAVLAGSCAEYDWSAGLLSETGTPLKPATLYGASKDALRRLAEAYCRQHGLRFAWGRLFFLYGPNEHPSRLVPGVVRSLLAGEEARCTDGEQRRDFLSTWDAGCAFAALLRSGVEGAVNIASGEAVSVRDIVLRLGRMLGRPELVRLGAVPRPPDDPTLIAADVRRLREEVGWKPRYSLDEGLRNVLEWYQATLRS